MPSLKDVRTLWQSKMGEKLSTTPYRYAYLGDGRGFAASNIFVPGDTGSNILYARSTPQNSHFFTILNRGTVAPTFNLPVVIGYKQDEPRTEQILGVHFGGLGNIASSSVPIIGLHHTTHEWLNPSGGGDAVLSKARQFMPLRVSVVSGFTIQVESSPETITGGFTLSTASTLDLTSLKPASGDLYALVYLTPDGVLSARAGSGIIAGPPSYNVPNYNNIPPLNPGERPLAAISLYAGQTQIHETQALQEIIDLRFATFTPGGVLVGSGTVGTIPKWNSSSSLGDSPLIVDTAMHIAPAGAVATNLLQFTGASWVPISSGSVGAILATTTPAFISGSGLAGTSASASHSDHIHQGVATISASGNAPSYGGITFIPGTNASISQSGGSITISGGSGGGSGGGAGLSTDTPAGVGASPTNGGASVGTPSNHIHKGILSILAGNGASIETNSAGCATISMAGSGWASAIQLANRSTNVTYANGSLTRIFTAAYAASTTVLAQADLQLKTGAASPPANIVDEFQMSGVADSEKFGLTGLVLPNEFYTVIDNSQVGASINLYKWTEYDDYGGAPVPAMVNRVFSGRLTNDGSNAVPTVDTVGTSAIWYVPHVGNQVSLYTTASVWNTITFNAASLNISSLSPNSNYDIWGYQNSAELSLLSTRWNVNNTARVNATSAQDGVQAEASNRTRVLLGTIRITGTSGQTEDSLIRRFVWNQYNRVNREMYVQSLAGGVYSTGSWRNYANTTASTIVEFVMGRLDNSPVPATVMGVCINHTTLAEMGIGYDGAAPTFYGVLDIVVGATRGAAIRLASQFTTPGYHYINSMQYGATNASFLLTNVDANIFS